MNTTLHNPYTRLCRAEVEEFPDEGGKDGAPAVTETGVPPAETAAPAGELATPPVAVPRGEEVDFSLAADAPEEEEDGGEVSPEEEVAEEEAPYVLELPEDFEATEEFKALLTEQAQASGLDGKAAGKYVSGVISAMQEAEQRNIAASTQELRDDWGKDFQANMQAVKRFSGKIMAKSGLTPEDMAPLQSPKGYRLLHALMQATGEKPLVSGPKTTPLSNPEKAHRMLTDPADPDFEAMHDTSHARHREVNAEYNRLVGLPPSD